MFLVCSLLAALLAPPQDAKSLILGGAAASCYLEQMTTPRKKTSQVENPSPDRTASEQSQSEASAELAQATNLSEVMDLIGKRAAERGLTDEKLKEILAESNDT